MKGYACDRLLAGTICPARCPHENRRASSDCNRVGHQAGASGVSLRGHYQSEQTGNGVNHHVHNWEFYPKYKIREELDRKGGFLGYAKFYFYNAIIRVFSGHALINRLYRFLYRTFSRDHLADYFEMLACLNEAFDNKKLTNEEAEKILVKGLNIHQR